MSPFAQLAPLFEEFHQLIDEVRTAPRLAHDRLGQRHRRGVVLIDQAQCQLATLIKRERLERDITLISRENATTLRTQ